MKRQVTRWLAAHNSSLNYPSAVVLVLTMLKIRIFNDLKGI